MFYTEMQSTHNEIHAAVTFEAWVLFTIIHASARATSTFMCCLEQWDRHR